ncbi:MAG: NAD(+)/NADH kinase [Rikenellaceae bacterium]|jgi:NAD+ kinase|nr:NAD(+)/NADH kinase [Rikenellaceae bacterium]
MKIALFASPQNDHSPDEVRRLLSAMTSHGVECSVNAPFAAILPWLCGIEAEAYNPPALPDGCEMMLCYGGDGTFLDGVRQAGGSETPLLGINSGRLGFLANVPRDGVERALEAIASGEFDIEKRSMLRIDGLPEEGGYAFNEFTVHRGDGAMIAVEVYVDGEMVGRYRGDGVILSTPTGSTAYSLSAGGPVVAPGCECFVISPIAPHNLTMRPVVIPDSCTVDFRVASREGSLSVSLDNRSYSVEGASTFRATKAERRANLVRLRGSSFYDTLRNKMMWGFDRRDEKN